MSKIGAGFMSADAAFKYEVQRTNNFKITFGDLGGAADIELACESTGLPSITNDPIELAYGNTKVKVAGQASVDDISVTVKDFIEPDIEKILWKWRLQVFNPETGKVGWAKVYKKSATITQYGPNGEAERKWCLKGVWPTNLDLGELNYDGGDKKSITMNLSVDIAYMVDRNAPGAGVTGGTGDKYQIDPSMGKDPLNEGNLTFDMEY